jgi:thiosulfate dehydrogenase [quinone] large subunit
VTRPSVPALALLPIRLFFGATFLYAGLDKLLDPSFFDATASTSIQTQLAAFARVSPLADLIRASLPLAVPIGLMIAVGEIGVGIGTLTGLAFRVAAIGGAALSGLFFLTASWGTHPYYFGADLPYAIGFVTLAIAGHGDVLVAERVRNAFAWMPGTEAPLGSQGSRARRRRAAARQNALLPGGARVGYSPDRASGRVEMRLPGDDVVASPERRVLLQTGLLAGLAAVVATFALPLRAMGIFLEPDTARTPTPAPGTRPTPSGSVPGPTAGGTASTAGSAITTFSAIDQGGGAAAFTVPFDAPAPLPAGDPGVVVKLSDGSYVAFDTICTHAGCTVEWDQQDAVLLCPCHDAAFDPAHGAAVLQGPARRPLAGIPITVNEAAGTISLGS